jgi:uncharacterized membrane protein YoaK (UPF0700 family)
MDGYPLSEKALHASLLILTLVTGLVDAASFVSMAHVFTANMTGNVIFLAFACTGVPELSINRSATALIASMVGGIAAGRIDLWSGSRKRKEWLAAALTVETILLFAEMFVTWRYMWGISLSSPSLYVVIALTAFGMGVRNGTIRKLGVPDLMTTVLTLTVAGLASEASLAGGTNPHWFRRVASIVMRFAGAAVGVLLLRWSLTLLLAVAGILSSLCAAIQIYRNETEQEAKFLRS